jgi:CheY-like chemotaxis protein
LFAVGSRTDILTLPDLDPFSTCFPRNSSLPTGLFIAVRVFAQRTEMARRSEEKFKGKRVLVVEDDPQVGEILKHLLTHYDHASQASSGNEALKIIKENPPDIILLDLTLPDMSGLEVAQRVRRNKRTKSIRILAMSATPVDKHIWSKSGCNDFILKPFSIPILLDRLSKLIRRSRKTS